MKPLLLLMILAVVACSPYAEDANKGSEVSFTAQDGVHIAATRYEGGERGVILLHMLNSNRNAWNDFAVRLNEKGYSVLSIDFRGHGQSDGDWREFSEQDFRDMILDVKAAKAFLGKKEIVVIGASIGANIAGSFSDSSVKGAVLLSPGIEYRGVKTKLEGSWPVLILAARGDRYAAESSQQLYDSAENAALRLYEGNEHGTGLLSKAEQDIFDWLREHVEP